MSGQRYTPEFKNEAVKATIEATFPAGSYRIHTDQPLGELLLLMLQPQAPDSFL